MVATGADTAPPRETRPLNPPGLFVAIGLFGALSIGVLAFTMSRTPQIPAVVSLDYTNVAGSVLTAQVRQADGRALAAALSARQPGLEVRIPDLSGAGFTLEGGAVHPMIRSAGIVAIYRNRLQDLVVWHQFAGSVDDLPSTTDVRVHGGHRYFVHRKSTYALVFWQDGSRVDVLTSSLPSEQVVALAYSAS